MTALDLFIHELARASARLQAAPVAVALSPHQPVAVGLPPSIYGLATCYDTGLSVAQGFVFFDTHDAFNCYRTKANP
jgi:hypothetical protein